MSMRTPTIKYKKSKLFAKILQLYFLLKVPFHAVFLGLNKLYDKPQFNAKLLFKEF